MSGPMLGPLGPLGPLTYCYREDVLISYVVDLEQEDAGPGNFPALNIFF
jgi:hypothetical protein